MRGATKRMWRRKSSPHSQRSSSIRVQPSQREMIIISTINDLPDVVLVEILCRLPCSKFVFQCKCVSKRWCTLISESYFVGRFIYLQIEYHAQTPITLINSVLKELVDIMAKPLNPFLRKLEKLHGLKEQFVEVVGTYNDLLLCCAGEHNQRSYYICNPYTQQWIDLPPPPPYDKEMEPLPEGFMCDLPYYKYAKDDVKGYIVQLNPEYRCRVVRLISHRYRIPCSEFKVQIFSSETGEWRESVVSSLQNIRLNSIDCNGCYAIASNRMLYWMSYGEFLLSFDPFLINNSVRTSRKDGDEDITDPRYKCRLVDNDSDRFSTKYLGVYRGCLKIYADDEDTNILLVLDLNGAEEFIHGGFENFFLENSKRMEMEMKNPEENEIQGVTLDPNNEEILYLTMDDENFMLNLRTRIFSKMEDKIMFKIRDKILKEELSEYKLPFVLTWWPTPVPGLPQHI